MLFAVDGFAKLVDIDEILVLKISHVAQGIILLNRPVLLACGISLNLDSLAGLRLVLAQHGLIYNLGALAEFLAALGMLVIEKLEVDGDETEKVASQQKWSWSLVRRG